MTDSPFKAYQRKDFPNVEARPFEKGEDVPNLAVSSYDQEKGSPKEGDMVARDPKTPSAQFLIGKDAFTRLYTPL